LKALIQTALITAPEHGGVTIFRRPVLERLMILCERAGITRFFIEADPAGRSALAIAMGRFAGRPEVTLVKSFSGFDRQSAGLAEGEPCLMLAGNLVTSRLQIATVMAHADDATREVLCIRNRGGEAAITAGPLDLLLKRPHGRPLPCPANRYLPVAVDGRPAEHASAETRLAQALRFETLESDGILARTLDRHLSWRISSRLARTWITPNQVTLANTFLGLSAALMFATPNYWWRLLGSLLFLVSIVFDGVDGEVARLKMAETKFGGMFDKLTDNLVNVAVFAGLIVGCYRSSGSTAYLYLLAIMAVGFGFCAISVARAFKVSGPDAEQWIGKVDRISGRDFAYLLVILAIFNGLSLFVWAAAFGTYVFALGLWWLTDRRRPEAERDALPHETGAIAEEV
jgi:phosphatidylglycerophosphate synthase